MGSRETGPLSPLLYFRYLFGMTSTALRSPLAPLREQLQAVVAGGRVASAPWPTGLPALDRALGGGIPRGRLTEVVGGRAVGKTALLRRVVAGVLATGGWVAWVDAGRTLAPAPWADLGARFVVIRPPAPTRCAWTVDLLLRSGVFALVVLDGAPLLSRVHGVRLSQLARERDAACVVLTHQDANQPTTASRLAGTTRLWVGQAPPSIANHAPRWATAGRHRSARHCLVTIEKGGAPSSSSSSSRRQPLEVPSVIVVARRVSTHSEIPDRRGVARSARRAWTARGNSTDGPAEQSREHPVTWGGLGVAADSMYGTRVPGAPVRLAAGRSHSAIAPSDRALPPPAERPTLPRRRKRRRHGGHTAYPSPSS